MSDWTGTEVVYESLPGKEVLVRKICRMCIRKSLNCMCIHCRGLMDAAGSRQKKENVDVIFVLDKGKC
jgi:hypothetical protein